VVKKSSLLEKLKTRWKTGSVRVDRTARGADATDSVAARRAPADAGLTPDLRPEQASGRKLSAREEAVVAMGEGFQELSNLVRGVQARVEDHGGRTSQLAEEISALPVLGRAQLDALKRIANHMDRQNVVGEKLLQTLGGVQDALIRASATDERTAKTLEDFRGTMDRIEGSMGKMVDSAESQAQSAAALANDRTADQTRMVEAIREGRREDVQTLVETQREGADRLQAATSQRLSSMQKMQEQHAADLTKLVTVNGKWTQLVIVLLSLTFFALAGILAVLAF